MTARIDPENFLDVLLPVVRQCAEASLIFYGNVADLGKAADTTLRGSQAQLASSVLTAVDTALQDIILTVVLQHFPQVRCIAEENTPLKRRFRGSRDADYKAGLLAEMEEKVWPLFTQGKLSPRLERTFAIGDVEAAFDALASNTVSGKLALVVDSALS